MEVREFEAADEDAVVALWRACDLTRAWNDPRRDIQRKVAVHDGLFLVGVHHGSIVATVMAGYEGHRGWINYLAVHRRYQQRGFGRMLMREAEHRLMALQCPKINLQVRTTNAEAVAFYDRLGYAVDNVISMGKRLEADTSPGARTDPR
jgi:ribosomal protein S18 acetylase RimI-like enzyme